MTEPDEAKQYAQSRIHGAGRAAWMAAPIKDELAMAYRAGQAASAERIKALEHIAKAAQQRANDHGEQLLDAYERIKALEGLLREIKPVAHLFQWNDLGDQIDTLLKEADQ